MYANYGREEDFRVLEAHNISCVDAIVLMRYSHGWRGAKVYEAEKHGAIGAIIFSGA